MLVVKHNLRHPFAMIADFEDAEWSIWPDAPVTAMAVERRFPEGFPGPNRRWAASTQPVSCCRIRVQYPNWRVGSLLYRIVGIQHYNPPCAGHHTCQIFMK